MLIPLFLAFIPLFLTMPLSLVLKTDKLFSEMVNSLTFGPPVIAIYYSTLIWIKQSSKSFTLILNSFFCLFILIPLLFILPLQDAKSFEVSDSMASSIKIILLIIGGTLVGIYLFFDLAYKLVTLLFGYWVQHKSLKELNKNNEFLKSERFELGQIFRYNLRNRIFLTF